MKAKIYSKKKIIGTTELQISDESMGCVSGKFVPNKNYEEVRKTIWGFYNSISDNKYEALSELRLNVQLENGVFLFSIGGFLIVDLEEFPNEEIEFESAGNYRHIIEDNFLSIPPKERIFEPWELISIAQKIDLEDKLLKVIEDYSDYEILNFRENCKYKLSEFEYSAFAQKFNEVLFAIHKKGEHNVEYVVIDLAFEGNIENDNSFRKIDLFEDFDHFLYYRLYPDKNEWEF